MKNFLFITTLILNSAAFAGDCVLTIKRDACPGKEMAALKPYNGKAETEEKRVVANTAACKVEAEKAARIILKGLHAKKTVTAKFEGAAAATATETSACQ